mmetsp:Transcript_11992/g.51463  ORF Transcript_11992/g.51463 Transcript_11992/m.51463 type:complete len:232 (-) Transcript_11992:1027-1722(-)
MSFSQNSGSSSAISSAPPPSVPANVAVANKLLFAFGSVSESVVSDASTTRRSERDRMASIPSAPHSFAFFSPSSVSSAMAAYAPCFSSRSISARLAFEPPPSGFSPATPPKMACSRPSFMAARSSMSRSYVPRITRRYTCTGLVWPMRCARASACASFWGFQSLSNTMTVSAATRLMPCPPARVESKNRNAPSASSPDPSSGPQKRSMAAWRARPVTPPSRRSYECPRLRE